MTRDERREHSKRICQKITGKISEFSPPGLGHWSKTWDLVEAPSDRFLDSLGRWRDEDTPEARLGVQEAGDALLVAWSDAGDLFRVLEGSGTREVDHAHT